MKQLITIMALCFALGQSTSTNAQDGEAVTQKVIPIDAIGQVCEIIQKNADPISTETDARKIDGKITGKVVRFDDEKVTLVDVSRTAQVIRGVPVLSSIPYIRRMFKNTAVIVEKLPGERTVDRRDIQNIKFAK